MNSKKLREFESVLKSAKLLNEEEKRFWLEQSGDLPEMVMESVITMIVKAETVVDKYIKIALENDKNKSILSETKKLIKQLENQGMKIAEQNTEKSNSAEEILKQLNNLN